MRTNRMPALLLLLAPLVVLLSLRIQSRSGWEGMKFGDSEAEIISRLGQPYERIDLDLGPILRYPDLTLAFRDDGLYRLQIEGDPDALYRKGLAYYGIPIESCGTYTGWVTNSVVARLNGHTMMVSRL